MTITRALSARLARGCACLSGAGEGSAGWRVPVVCAAWARACVTRRAGDSNYSLPWLCLVFFPPCREGKAPHKTALQDFTALLPKSLVYSCRQELQSTVSKGSRLLGRNLRCLWETESAEECQLPCSALFCYVVPPSSELPLCPASSLRSVLGCSAGRLCQMLKTAADGHFEIRTQGLQMWNWSRNGGI